MTLPAKYYDFRVGETLFAAWFNSQRVKHPSVFKDPIIEVNFRVFYENLPLITGSSEITLHEFIGHFCIAYNETGGTFRYAIREGGDRAYIFSQRTIKGSQTKKSYNIPPNRLAGNQLKEMGIISSAAEVRVWNGKVYPEGVIRPEILQALPLCDFWRFRGYGFNQLTWRTNFEVCVAPIVLKKYGAKMDAIETEAEFEKILKDPEVSFTAFRNYIFSSKVAEKAIDDLKKGEYAAYGNLVSGGWGWYVTNLFLPRCVKLEEMLERNLKNETKRYSIDGLGLTRPEIRTVQEFLIDYSDETEKIIVQNGGADGYWGNATERAWKIAEERGLTFDKILKEA